ncbi:MAG: GNAT family N-acetyltransferase [Chloroflexota bacterium]
MQFTLHNDFSDIPAAAWNELASAGISDTPFARHEYLRLWWQTRGGGEWPEAELVLVSASEAGHLVGIAPLFATEHDGRRALLLIGSIEISDYLDVLVRSADVPRFLRGLLDFLAGAPNLKGLPLDWYNIVDSSPTLPALKAEAGRRGWAHREEIFRPTPHIALGGDFEAYLAGLEKKQRHEIRRKMRRAAEGPTPSRFELLESPALLEPGIEDLLELMAHDADKARFLNPAMRDHMRSFMRIAWEGGYLWMAFLMVDGSRAAAAFNFDYNNRLWGYNSAVNREFMELSPGWVLLTHQIQWACDHGRSQFDFMRGDEEYKYRFGAVNRYVNRAYIVPS